MAASLLTSVPSDVNDMAPRELLRAAGVTLNRQTLAGGATQIGIDLDGWSYVSGITLADAERLLDWLENHGIGDRQLQAETDGTVLVRWYAPDAG